MINRREWIAGSAATAAAATSAVGEPTSGAKKPVVIASANGMAPCAKAMEMLKNNADTLDAVIAGVNIIELDPNDTSVGYGGLPNEDCVVELDACVMHGPTQRAGSVGAIQGVKTPSKIAKLVMDHTTHVMIVGEGATRFAEAHGYRREDLLTDKARTAWLVWKESLRSAGAANNWLSMRENLVADGRPPLDQLRNRFPQVDEGTLAWAWQMAVHPTYGTINCMALNEKGEISGVTTTSGLAWKIPGRLGDSPIIGAGLFVDPAVGGGGSTGLGELNIRVAGGHTIVESMRRGLSPKDAVMEALKRVSKLYNDDKAIVAKLDINFYALRVDGEHAGGTLWHGPKEEKMYSVNDGGASRLERCVALYER